MHCSVASEAESIERPENVKICNLLAINGSLGSFSRDSFEASV